MTGRDSRENGGKMRWPETAGTIVMMAMAVGCIGPSTQIVSNRAPAFTTKLSELFVVSQAGMDGELNGRHFEDKLVATGAKCGLRLGVTGMTGLELDPAIHTQRMKAFGARHILLLRLTGGTKDPGGGIVSAQYDGRLYDADQLGQESASMLWRADVRLRRGDGPFGDAGEQLAEDLLRQLKKDGLIKPCAELADPLRERGARYAR